MNDNKRYYWIKLKTDFFNQETIDFLLSQKNGCEYIVLYQMLCLNTANNNGKMCSKIGEMIIPYNIEKIIRDTKYFDFDTVTIALELFKKLGLVYEENDKILKISNFDEMVGSEVSSAKRVRKFREKKALLEEGEKIPKKEPKSNAIRQKQFRAKKQCEQKQHIPYIEDYINNKRYNGNYYIVIQRDKYKCALCNSIENLCVHHIDGYDELKPENSNENKMITLCRNCHSNVHAGQKIDEDTFNSIDYYIDSNEMLLCNNDVTQEIEYRDKSIDKDINIENNNINSPAKAVQCKEIIDYLNLKANTQYRHNIKKTQSLINARFNESFTIEDFKKVIDNKVNEWKNTEMEKYLRPETLFGTKFESYLNQKKKETLEEMMERITKRNEQRTGN